MSVQWWVISDGAGNLRQVMTDGGSPADAGENVVGRTVVKMDRRGDFETEMPDFTAGKWRDNLAVLKPLLMTSLDDQREAEQMRYLTAGGAKKMVYIQKAKEVADFRTLGSAALAALNLEGRRIRFPAAMAEADLTGVPLATVISKMEAAANDANSKVYKIEALAQRAKTAVAAAKTAVQARAAATVNWTVA